MRKINSANTRQSNGRRAWAQDTTLYIEPTSDVREIRLQPAWANLSSEQLSAKLRF